MMRRTERYRSSESGSQRGKYRLAAGAANPWHLSVGAAEKMARSTFVSCPSSARRRNSPEARLA